MIPTRALAGIWLWLLPPLTAGAQVSAPLPAGAQQAAQAPVSGEVVSEVRLHGNYATPDAEVFQIAGVTIGQALEATTLAEVEERLRRSGRFDEVEVRKRYRSLVDTKQVALVIIVREHPSAEEGQPPPGPLQRFKASTMFLPVLNYADGYGFTYGARVSFVDQPARGGRLSVPLTWGGTKRAALELDQRLPGRVFDRVGGAAAIQRRRNPHYELDDDRREVSLGFSRQLADAIRLGLRGGVADVGFGDIDESLTQAGAELTLDTRLDPLFPRNAIFANAAWDWLDPSEGRAVNRFRAEAQAYAGLIGPSVFALRWQYGTSDRALPLYERFLLGGTSSLRGHRTGAFSGDSLMAGSAEIRVPLTSPIRLTKLGLAAFADAGTTWDHGTRIGDARVEYGFGGAVFLYASIFQVRFDVGIRPSGVARGHLTIGLQF
jgi:outer membrane protein assembly factor BamA